MWGDERPPTIPQPFHFATDARAGDHEVAAAAEGGGSGAPRQGASSAAQRALLAVLLEEGADGATPSRDTVPTATAAPADTTLGWAPVDITRM